MEENVKEVSCTDEIITRLRLIYEKSDDNSKRLDECTNNLLEAQVIQGCETEEEKERDREGKLTTIMRLCNKIYEIEDKISKELNRLESI